jgi:hypothetical protein
MHDIPKYKRIKAKMEFCGHSMVNILQNVSQNRPDKKVTRRDFAHSIYAAFLAYYGGETKRYTGSAAIFFPHPMLYYVKGLANGKARIIWMMKPGWYKVPNQYNNPDTATSGNWNAISSVNTQAGIDLPATDIYPPLQIKEGEKKLILEVCFCKGSTQEARKYFGFLLTSPKSFGDYVYFNTIVVFTPKAGLFDETVPPAS